MRTTTELTPHNELFNSIYYHNVDRKEAFNELWKKAKSTMTISEDEFLRQMSQEFNEWCNTVIVKEVNGKMPICNGSVNDSLTLDELLQFDAGRKASFIHNLQVSGQYNTSFSVLPEVFVPMDSVYQWSEIKELLNGSEEELNLALTTVYNKLSNHRSSLLRAEQDYYYKLGLITRERLKEVKIRGEFEMPLYQLIGYIKSGGNWNDFNTERVNQSLKLIDKTFPRRNYGVNNCNTGQKQHVFTTMNDYIFLKVSYCNSSELARFIEWFEQYKNEIAQINKCDSIRYEANEFEHDGRDFTLVMWWD